MQLEQNQIRTDDIEFVQELAESLGLNEEQSKDPIEELVMKRIQSSAGTPLSGFSESVENSRDMGELKAYLEDTHDRLDSLEQKMEASGSNDSGGQSEPDSNSSEQSLESVFGEPQEDRRDAKEPVQDDPVEPVVETDEDVETGDGVVTDGEELDDTVDEIDSEVQMDSSDFDLEGGDAMEVFGSDQMEDNDD